MDSMDCCQRQRQQPHHSLLLPPPRVPLIALTTASAAAVGHEHKAAEPTHETDRLGGMAHVGLHLRWQWTSVCQGISWLDSLGKKFKECCQQCCQQCSVLSAPSACRAAPTDATTDTPASPPLPRPQCSSLAAGPDGVTLPLLMKQYQWSQWPSALRRVCASQGGWYLAALSVTAGAPRRRQKAQAPTFSMSRSLTVMRPFSS